MPDCESKGKRIGQCGLAVQRRALVRIQEDLEIVERPALSSLVNWTGASEQPIHRWFRYREGFSPELISALELGERILDPFCGIGSIMLGAAASERVSVGIDLNPLAIFAARVKLRPLSPAELDLATQFRDSFRSTFEEQSPWPKPALRIADKLFEPKILETILKLRSAIEEIAPHSNVRDFLFLAWLAVLERVGSYFKEGNGIKYRNKKRNPGKYLDRPDGDWQLQRFGEDQVGFVLDSLQRQLNMMLDDTRVWPSNGSLSRQTIHRGNALDLLHEQADSSFDSIVFSPPYANRFDYFESMKVELWFGGFVEQYSELRDLRKDSVRSNLASDLTRSITKRQELEELIGLMDANSSSWRMRVPRLLRGYFSDMREVLVECRRLLKSGGKCCVIVGNSAYAGVVIPTDALLAKIGQEMGFRSVQLWPVRHLTVAPQQRDQLQSLSDFMRESVVVFRA